MRVGGAILAEARQKPDKQDAKPGDKRHMPERDWF